MAPTCESTGDPRVTRPLFSFDSSEVNRPLGSYATKSTLRSAVQIFLLLLMGSMCDDAEELDGAQAARFLRPCNMILFLAVSYIRSPSLLTASLGWIYREASPGSNSVHGSRPLISNLVVDVVCAETFLLRRPRRHGSRWRRPPTSFVDMEKAGLLNSKPRLWLRGWLDLWQTSLLCVEIGNELYLDHSMFCVLRQLWFGNITICNISTGAIIAFDPRKWKWLQFVGRPVRLLFLYGLLSFDRRWRSWIACMLRAEPVSAQAAVGIQPTHVAIMTHAFFSVPFQTCRVFQGVWGIDGASETKEALDSTVPPSKNEGIFDRSGWDWWRKCSRQSNLIQSPSLTLTFSCPILIPSPFPKKRTIENMATWSSTWRPRQLDLNLCRSPGSSLNLTKKKERELSTHGMLARKEEVASKKAQVARDASTTITTATGHVMAVSEFIAQFGTPLSSSLPSLPCLFDVMPSAVVFSRDMQINCCRWGCEEET